MREVGKALRELMSEDELRQLINTHAMSGKRMFGTGIWPSHGALNKLLGWFNDGQTVQVARPSWEETYLNMAHTLAKRSQDAQTQCGCVIVSQDMKPLAWGYNGFPGGIIDELLPNMRPDKYDWMLHSEINALLNCSVRPVGGVVYQTGHPCLHCLLCMAQAGISKIVYDCSHDIVMVDNKEMMAKVNVAKWLLKDHIEVCPYVLKQDG